MDHTFAEAAELLPVSEGWLRKNFRQIGYYHEWSAPGAKKSSLIFFTDEDLAAIRAWAARRPEPAVGRAKSSLQAEQRRRRSA